jgi:hypothetical protein
MVMSMAPGVSNIYVYEAPNGGSLWVDLLNAMVTNTAVKQFSCSWGGGGSDPASEQVFQQMAAQGQSFYNASGDSDAFTGAVPFPADSPNITQVGGTTLGTDDSGNYVSETVWNRGYVFRDAMYEGSSGGISPAVAIPSWQLGVDMTANHGSVFQRNIPDVALTGDNVFVIYSNGVSGKVGGTSCAAPLWAGLAALINQQAAQLGQPSVGFVNPALYAIARSTNYSAVFHDITAGNNFNASSPTNFSAVPGYDLCTGWGTPAGTNLINALTTPDYLGVLPATIFSASGLVGGPFTQTNWLIMLTNTGVTSLNWSLGGAPSWLSAAPTSGTLAAHGAATVSLTLQNAAALPADNYLGVVEITNQTLNRVQMAGINLAVGQSIVQNGGFETGDFTGWTLVGDTKIGDLIYNEVIYFYNTVVHSGNYGALLGEYNYDATLSQTLMTIPGQRYLVSCWLDNPQSGNGEHFSASWNGTNFVNLLNPPVLAWTNIQFIATATGSNTLLQFAARNDPNYFGFDDVSVTPVPAVTFASFSARTNVFQLAWNSLAGLSYQIQYKTNLAQAGWLNFSTVAATNTVTTFEDTNSLNASQRFYRLGLLP